MASLTAGSDIDEAPRFFAMLSWAGIRYWRRRIIETGSVILRAVSGSIREVRYRIQVDVTTRDSMRWRSLMDGYEEAEATKPDSSCRWQRLSEKPHKHALY